MNTQKMRIISFNVNGIRAIQKKGFLEWMKSDSPDILCLQETKALKEQLDKELIDIPGYHSIFCSAEKKGYSGVAVYSKIQPVSVSTGFGITEFDSEGRIISADYGHFCLFNIYFPNGKASLDRLKYKMDFYQEFLKQACAVSKKKCVIVCGDFNTAHTEIDLARPHENENVSGFLPEERAWMDEFISSGFTDTFRMFEKSGGNYSWWDYKTRARERNIGWRIDYFFISSRYENYVTDAFILDSVQGSDHCPVGMDISFQGEKSA